MNLRLFGFATLALLALGALPAHSTPAACVSDCAVTGTSWGFVAPATEIRSGASVVWTSLDTSHTNAEGAPLSSVESCFLVGYSSLAPSLPVRFDIVDGELRATVDGETRTCTDARALPDGSFLLAYYCVQHPAQMRAALLVTP